MENGQGLHPPVKVYLDRMLIILLIVVAIQCDALSDPDNGAVSVTGTGVGDTATYTCDDGYELIGSSTRTCQSNGDWSGSPPTCEGIPKNNDTCFY